MIYFDNAATTYPKPREVIRALALAARHSGNPGRSSHALSLRAAEIIYDTREKISDFFHHKNPESVVFTYNATYAINLAINALVKPGSHVITSNIEHNAVMRALYLMKERFGIEVSEFNCDADITEEIAKLVRANTSAIVSTLASNVTGKTISLSILSECAKKHGIRLIVDASQYAGHADINLEKNPCDALCAPAHKGLFGVQGSGFTVFREHKRLTPLIAGGSGHDSISHDMPILLPEGYEAGTLSTPTIAALGAGIKFLSAKGMDEVGERLDYLSKLLYSGIKEIKKAVIYPSFGGIISFNISGMSASEVALALDKRSIAVRAGLHCAPAAHSSLGTLGIGTVRASLSYLNKKSEIDAFCLALDKISRRK